MEFAVASGWECGGGGGEQRQADGKHLAAAAAAAVCLLHNGPARVFSVPSSDLGSELILEPCPV